MEATYLVAGGTTGMVAGAAVAATGAGATGAATTGAGAGVGAGIAFGTTGAATGAGAGDTRALRGAATTGFGAATTGFGSGLRFRALANAAKAACAFGDIAGDGRGGVRSVSLAGTGAAAAGFAFPGGVFIALTWL